MAQRISRMDLWHISIPLRRTFYPTWIPGYPQTHNRFTLLQLTTSSGLKGFAAGAAFGRERGELGNLMAPYLLGQDPNQPDTLYELLTAASFLGWRNFWIEAAIWDLKAKIEGKPLWMLLRDMYPDLTKSTKSAKSTKSTHTTPSPRIPLYLSTGECCRPKEHSKQAEMSKNMGFEGIKLRVRANTVEEDINVIKNTREILRDYDYPIMVDANQGWLVRIVEKIPKWDVDRAIQFISGIQPQNIKWVEEPLDMHNYEGLAEVRQFCREFSEHNPLLSGCEFNNGWNDARMMMHFGSLDIYQPDATIFGMHDILKTIQECKSQNLYFSPHTWTNGLGLLYNAHIKALTLGADGEGTNFPLEFPWEIDSWTPEVRDGIFHAPLMPDAEGKLCLGEEPGIGIAERLDWERVEKFGEHFFSITEGRLASNFIKEKGIINAIKLKFNKFKGGEGI